MTAERFLKKRAGCCFSFEAVAFAFRRVNTTGVHPRGQACCLCRRLDSMFIAEHFHSSGHCYASLSMLHVAFSDMDADVQLVCLAGPYGFDASPNA